MPDENEQRERETRSELIQEWKPPYVLTVRKALAAYLPSEISEAFRAPTSRSVTSWTTVRSTKRCTRGR